MEHLKLNPDQASLPRLIESSPPSKQRMALILRCQKILFAAYRADQYADAEGFMNSLGAVLEQFPDEVVVYITDPRTGIQRRSKWPPTISDVVEAAERHQEHLATLRAPRMLAVERQPRPLLRDLPQGHLAQVFVPEGHSRYAVLVKWSETAEPVWWKYGKSSDGRNGIWVSHGAWSTPIQE